MSEHISIIEDIIDCINSEEEGSEYAETSINYNSKEVGEKMNELLELIGCKGSNAKIFYEHDKQSDVKTVLHCVSNIKHPMSHHDMFLKTDGWYNCNNKKIDMSDVNSDIKQVLESDQSIKFVLIGEVTDGVKSCLKNEILEKSSDEIYFHMLNPIKKDYMFAGRLKLKNKIETQENFINDNELNIEVFFFTDV